MVLTTQIKEAAHADDGYQPRPWINTARLSHPGSASGTQILRRSFPTLEDSTNPTLDSSRSAKSNLKTFAADQNGDKEIVFAVLPLPASAWNIPGHMLSGIIIRQENPSTIEKVKAVLEKHPGYANNGWY